MGRFKKGCEGYGKGKIKNGREDKERENYEKKLKGTGKIKKNKAKKSRMDGKMHEETANKTVLGRGRGVEWEGKGVECMRKKKGKKEEPVRNERKIQREPEDSGNGSWTG